MLSTPMTLHTSLNEMICYQQWYSEQTKDREKAELETTQFKSMRAWVNQSHRAVVEKNYKWDQFHFKQNETDKEVNIFQVW